MSELETVARRAGAAARDEAALRLDGVPAPTRLSPPARSRRRAPLLVAAAAVVVVVVAVTVAAIGPVRTPVIDAARPPAIADVPGVGEPVAVDGVLPVPEPGSALPAYLEDGRPVFVSHPEPGEVVVLDAVDPRAPRGWQQMVAWCETSGWFEELRHGSRFNGWGEWTGGPAPTGLAVHPSELADDGKTVRVAGPTGRGPDREDRVHEQSPRGRSCADGPDGGPDGGGRATYHQPPSDTAGMDGDELPADRWVWAELVIGGTEAAPLVCDADGICRHGAPAVSGIEARGNSRVPNRVPRTLLARTLDSGEVEIIVPATDNEGPHPGLAGWPDPDWLLRVPEPGGVLASHLDNQAPVWVVHAPDGQLRVLNATSTVNPSNLTAWCPDQRQFTDITGERYDAAGVSMADAEPLAAYPTEVVDFGDTRGVRVTGAPQAPAAGRDGQETKATPACDQPLVHEPHEDAYVSEPGVILSGEDRWQWARMEIQLVDGELYLCAGSDQPCGALGDPDLGARCTFGDRDDPDTLECEPYRDPVVTTPGAEPTDGPKLMLIRGLDGGRAADIRFASEELAADD